MSFFHQAGDSDSDSDDESIRSSNNGQAKKTTKKAAGKKPPTASMFMRGGDDSDSDEESSEEEEELMDESEEDESEEDEGEKKAAKPNRAAAFMVGAESEDEESSGDERVIVRSAKDKRLEEMETAVKVMENASKINDWVAISAEFDKLLRFISRHQTQTLALPAAAQLPPLFVSSVIDLESSISSAAAKEKEGGKKMNASNAKALNGMKQKVRKTLREYETAVESYKKDAAAFEEAYQVAIAGSGPKEVETLPKSQRKAVEEEQPATDDFMTVGKGGRALNLTSEGVFKTLKTINEARGKKNTDRAETVKILSRLLEVSSTPYQKIRVLLALVSSRLDYSTVLSSMPHDSWCAALKETNELISMMLGEQKSNYIVVESVDEYDDMVERAPGQGDEKEGERVKVRGSIISFVENLDNEFTKTLQNTDQHGSEYVERLREEKPLYEAIVKAQVLFEREGWDEPIARAVMRRLEHVYSKPDIIVDVLEKVAVASVANETSRITPVSAPATAKELVHNLAVYLYSTDLSLIRTRAMLAHIYHHALHGRYHEARDMMLMSHLQDNIQHADVATQILYNRVVVQLGLAAFKKGYIAECQSTLLEIFSSQKPKELLAQGIQRFSNNTPDQELIEKRRLLPFHLHINLELLETAFLVSCMLQEIPLLASLDSEEQRRKVSSKPFRRLLDQADRQTFMGPPENTRDHIMQASKALQTGEWEKAKEMILSIKIWGLLDDPADIKEKLARKIQEEGLRTYLFTYAPYYDSLSLSLLATTFALPIRSVISIVSKMIWTDELPASLDQIDGVVVFHRVEQSRVQQLAQELATKAEYFVEQNEKTLDIKLGSGPGGREDGGRGDKGAGEGGRGRGERRGRGTYRGRGGRGRGGFQSGLGSSTKVSA